MKEASTKKDELDIPELTREQLGKGVRGKYHKQFMAGTNLVAIRPDIHKVFPNSEAVNAALETMITIAHQTHQLVDKPKRPAKKRAAA